MIKRATEPNMTLNPFYKWKNRGLKLTYSRSHQLSEVVLFLLPSKQRVVPKVSCTLDHPGRFKHCLTSASKCSDLTALGTTWATGLYLKLPRWLQRAAKSRNEWVGVKIRISQDAFVYESMPHTSFPSLSKGVCVWEKETEGQTGRQIDPQTLVSWRQGGKVEFMYVFRDIHLEKVA